MLDALLVSLLEIGWPGRVEIIDQRVKGVRTYALRAPQQVRDRWPDTTRTTIGKLSNYQLSWIAIFMVNRGYWDEVSEPTLIAKIRAPVTSVAWKGIVEKSLELSVNIYVIIISNLSWPMQKASGFFFFFFSALWSKLPTSLNRPSILGWPFSLGYNAMGMSVAREDVKPMKSTLGGYVEFQDPRYNVKRCLGITCYHVIQADQHGNIDLSKVHAIISS